MEEEDCQGRTPPARAKFMHVPGRLQCHVTIHSGLPAAYKSMKAFKLRDDRAECGMDLPGLDSLLRRDCL